MTTEEPSDRYEEVEVDDDDDVEEEVIDEETDRASDPTPDVANTSRTNKPPEYATKDMVRNVDQKNVRRMSWLFIVACLALSAAVVAILLPTVILKDDDDDQDKGISGDDEILMSPIAAPTMASSSSPTTLRFGQFLEVYLIPALGEEVFADSGTPYFKAADFIANEDPFVSELTSVGELADRYGSTLLYFALGGDDWTACSRESNVCGTTPWLADTSVCEWDGITCNGEGRISSIIFDSANGSSRKGSLPPEMVVFEQLEEFVLVDSQLVTGPLPDTRATNATNLTRVVLSNLALDGPIPDGYLSMSPIMEIDFTGNMLTGVVPNTVGTTDSLLSLRLGDNDMTGSIPDLSMYSSLAILDLGMNNLAGSIPDSIWTLTELVELILGGNDGIGGELSPRVEDMTSLQVLDLSNTGLEGFLPDEIFNMESLMSLSLNGASLVGPISSSFSLLADTLEQLSLQENGFTGTVPSTFGLMTNLGVLMLDMNDLVGTMPDEVCALRDDAILTVLTADCDEIACSCCTECA